MVTDIMYCTTSFIGGFRRHERASPFRLSCEQIASWKAQVFFLCASLFCISREDPSSLTLCSPDCIYACLFSIVYSIFSPSVFAVLRALAERFLIRKNIRPSKMEWLCLWDNPFRVLCRWYDPILLIYLTKRVLEPVVLPFHTTHYVSYKRTPNFLGIECGCDNLDLQLLRHLALTRNKPSPHL